MNGIVDITSIHLLAISLSRSLGVDRPQGVILRARSHTANAKATSLIWVLNIPIVPFTLSERERDR